MSKVCDNCGKEIDTSSCCCKYCGYVVNNTNNNIVNNQNNVGYKFCRFCGTRLPVISKFCDNCGKSIEIENSIVENSDNMVTTDNVSNSLISKLLVIVGFSISVFSLIFCLINTNYFFLNNLHTFIPPIGFFISLIGFLKLKDKRIIYLGLLITSIVVIIIIRYLLFVFMVDSAINSFFSIFNSCY